MRIHYLIKYQKTVYRILYEVSQDSILKRAHLSGDPLVISPVRQGIKKSHGLVLNGYVELSSRLNYTLCFLQSEGMNGLDCLWLCSEVLVEGAESV